MNAAFGLRGVAGLAATFFAAGLAAGLAAGFAAAFLAAGFAAGLAAAFFTAGLAAGLAAAFFTGAAAFTAGFFTAAAGFFAAGFLAAGFAAAGFFAVAIFKPPSQRVLGNCAMSRTANSGAVFPGMQVFFVRFCGILWELHHAILIGGIRKSEDFTRGRFGVRDTCRRCRSRLLVRAQEYLERCEQGAEPCCSSLSAEWASAWRRPAKLGA